MLKFEVFSCTLHLSIIGGTSLSLFDRIRDLGFSHLIGRFSIGLLISSATVRDLSYCIRKTK